MSHQTCTLSSEVKDLFQKIRFTKEKSNSCLILKIDTAKLSVILDKLIENCDLDTLGDELPESSPRYLVISFKLEHKDGRVSYPLVGLYYK